MAETNAVRVGGILLAAGGSTRMGRPKQLVEFEGTSLLRRAAQAMIAASCRPCIAVLGAGADRCREELAGLDIGICLNDEWATGMSSSIKAGLKSMLQADPETDAVIITLCDQPYISAAIIDNFIAEYRRIRPLVIASAYNDVTGVPTLFSRDMFESILKLKGDQGARGLIQDAGDQAVKLDVPEAAFDIDSPGDLPSVGDSIK